MGAKIRPMRAAVRRELGIPSSITSIMNARLWPDSTVVCLGTGPSLTQADVDYCCGKAKVIAISDAYRWAPWADALYSCDSRWWTWHKGVPTFTGHKYSLDARVKKPFPEITVFKNTGDGGLELTPGGLRTGRNSGYQAINLAVHLGAKRIILLGYDMQAGQGGRSHFFGEHPNRVVPPFKLMRRHFGSLVLPLAALGVEIVNASRSSALTAFPRVALETALPATLLAESVA
jgi:hypothetical protein